MAGEVPQYFLLNWGGHFIVAETVVAVAEGAVTSEIQEQFKRAASTSNIAGCELPAAGDTTAWVKMQVSRPTPPPAPPPSRG